MAWVPEITENENRVYSQASGNLPCYFKLVGRCQRLGWQVGKCCRMRQKLATALQYVCVSLSLRLSWRVSLTLGNKRNVQICVALVGSSLHLRKHVECLSAAW